MDRIVLLIRYCIYTQNVSGNQMKTQITMRATLIILTFIINQMIFGQFGFIEDNDGYVNIRSSSKNIIDTLASGQIIYCFELEGEWLPIDYDLSRQNKSGYVHK